MRQGIRIKMLDTEIILDSPDNTLALSSVKCALLLPNEAVVSLSYEADGCRRFCRTNDAGTLFVLPDDWKSFQFIVDSNKASSRASSVFPMDFRHSDSMKQVMTDWERRVFIVYGRNNSQGSGVLISNRRILTAAHLGFTLGDSYLVNGTNQCFRVECQFISKHCDIAVLTSADLPEVRTRTEQIRTGSDFFLIGFPEGSRTPSITHGVLGKMKDYTFYVEAPGSRRGYSGAPVFDDLSRLSGLLLGGNLSAKQKDSHIVGICTINSFINGGDVSDSQS